MNFLAQTKNLITFLIYRRFRLSRHHHVYIQASFRLGFQNYLDRVILVKEFDWVGGLVLSHAS